VLLGSAVPRNDRVPPGSGGGDMNWIDDWLRALGSGHTRGAHVAVADGSVRFVNETIAWHA
jgi:hypothetical protein